MESNFDLKPWCESIPTVKGNLISEEFPRPEREIALNNGLPSRGNLSLRLQLNRYLLYSAIRSLRLNIMYSQKS